jgi:ABC-2 type transport system permease protein
MLGALKYEWRRLWSVRATWIMSFVYLAFLSLVGIGPIYALQSSDPTQTQSWQALFGTGTEILVVFFLSVVAAQSFGHEYRYGTIRLTLTSFPKREKILLAKVIVFVAYALLMVFIGWAVLYLLGSLLVGDMMTADSVGTTVFGSTPPELWQVPVFTIAYGLFVFSFTLLLRNLSLGIIIPLLLAILIEPLLIMVATLGGDRWSWVEKVVPLTNANNWIAQSENATTAGLTFGVWVIAIHLIAVWSYSKRDA